MKGAEMLEMPTPSSIARARERISGIAIHSPLLTLTDEDANEHTIMVKPELLQPTRSFKVRGAANCILRGLEDSDELHSVVTVSAGNMGLAARYVSARLGLPTRIIVPDSAPAAKADRLERMGAVVERVPFAQWWEHVEIPQPEAPNELFVHPFLDPEVIAGNATIGVEIAADAGVLDAVYVPFGGGGLAAGIAAGLALAGSNAKVYGVEVSTSTPLSAAFNAGRSFRTEHTPSFIDGIGSSFVLPPIFELLRANLAGSVVVTHAEVKAAIAWGAAQGGFIAEGAGGAALAAARKAARRGERAVAVASGGNIDPSLVSAILGAA